MKEYHAQIYLIRHKKTKDVIYVGSTMQTLEQRFAQHCNDIRRPIHTVLKNHKNDFEIVQIDSASSKEERYLKEEFWSLFFSKILSLLNGKFGNALTNDTREKLSVSHKGIIPWNKGKKMSEEFCRKNSEAHKGQICSDETKEKLRKLSTGRKHNKEELKKMGLAHKGLRSHNRRPIYCYEKNKAYISIAECAKELNVTHACLYTALKRHDFCYGCGYHFKMLEKGGNN